MLLCAVAASPCEAQGAKGRTGGSEDDELKRRAYGFFSKGELLFGAGDYIKAAEAFLLAYETLPHPATLLNIAICWEKAGRPADAIGMYERYLATSDAKDKQGRSGAEERIAALSKLAGSLDVSCGMPRCEVMVDGKLRGAAPLVIKVDPGVHKVEALSRGAVVLSMEAVVRPGKATRVDLKALPAADSAAVPGVPVSSDNEVIQGEGGAFFEPIPEPTKKRRLGVPFWIATGATVASGVLAGVFSAQFQKDVDEYTKAKNVDIDKANEWADKGERDMLVANVMWGVTGAAALTAVVFAILDLVPRDKAKAAPSQEPEVSAFIAPGSGLGLSVSF
jgi:tetratricopeptide (TPR) repeat protein